MTNIAKAIDRLREERRDAQNQVQKLVEAISVLWPRKHVGLRSGRSRKQPKRRAGRRLCEGFALARLQPAGFLPGNLGARAVGIRVSL